MTPDKELRREFAKVYARQIAAIYPNAMLTNKDSLAELASTEHPR